MMGSDTIKVGMADLKSCKSPSKLTTLGLGSCVGIIIYDPIAKVGGLCHAMLPDSTQIRNNSNRAKFVDTAVEDLLIEMKAKGVTQKNLVAKLAGGAQMFKFQSGNDLMKIGQRNVIAAKEVLENNNIRIIAEDTGENFGRTIEFDTSNGDLMVRSIGKEIKII